ncbi:hypothetical protein TSUD_230420 [Trifolium subterraneum]|nr:hypothetical protein TSUD_230420 [Trifolium subterraneum]
MPEFPPVNPLLLIREILPVVKFSELAVVEYSPESCTVCLYEFKAEDEIQRLTNCRHIFHRNCLDHRRNDKLSESHIHNVYGQDFEPDHGIRPNNFGICAG